MGAAGCVLAKTIPLTALDVDGVRDVRVTEPR